MTHKILWRWFGVVLESKLAHRNDFAAFGYFFKILEVVQTLHFNSETPLKNEGMENTSALMMQLCGRQVMMTRWTETESIHNTATVFPTKLVVSHNLMHVPRHEQCHTHAAIHLAVRDARPTVQAVVWAVEVYWQRWGVFLNLDAKTEWMVHVNYKSPMNHLVFS